MPIDKKIDYIGIQKDKMLEEATLVIAEFLFIRVSKEHQHILTKYLVAVFNEELCQICHLQIQRVT